MRLALAQILVIVAALSMAGCASPLIQCGLHAANCD
jgi:hypothetical protein